MLIVMTVQCSAVLYVVLLFIVMYLTVEVVYLWCLLAVARGILLAVARGIYSW